MSKQARIRTQEMRRARQAAAVREARRRRVLTWVGGLVVIGLVVAIGVAVAKASQGGAGTTTAGRVVVPDNLTPTAAIPVGAETAPVTVEIYFDYMCPACGKFEAANGDELSRLVEDGTVKLELRPLSFLDPQSSGTQYSTRTANAIATVADAAPGQAWSFHAALYEAQPHEGSAGLSDAEIGEVAADAGVPVAVVDRFTDRTFDGWVASVTQKAFDSGVSQTPTVEIDGVPFTGDLFRAGPLTEAILAAKAGK